MSVLSDKILHLRQISGVDVKRADEYANVSDGDVSTFTVVCEGKKRTLSVPKNTDKAVIALIRAYFADTEKEGLDDAETVIYRLISGVATPEEIVGLDKRIAGKKYMAELLLTTDPDKWNELFAYVEALSGNEDILVRCDLNSALYLKFCDGSYDRSEELARVLYGGITGDRKIDLTVCSGGFACGSDGIMSAYSRALAALRLNGGAVRHYSDCALVDLMRKVPEKDLIAFLEYLSSGKGEYVLSDSLQETAETFFDCDLNANETAKKLFLHRNTLQSRLKKIEEITGIDLRSFRGAELFNLITASKIALGQKR